MKKLYTILIAIGILIEFILLFFFDIKIAVFGPIIFWLIMIFGIINYGVNIFKLSNSIKKTKTEIYRKHSIGIMITRNALSNNEFLNVLNSEEKELILKNRIIFKYLFICFGLFVISALLIVFKNL